MSVVAKQTEYWQRRGSAAHGFKHGGGSGNVHAPPGVVHATARDNPTGVVDTAGTAFAWQCDDDGCRVAMDATTPRAPACEDDEVAGYGYAAAHFLSIMSACNNTWLEQWERPIACQRDADCPQLYEFSTDSRFECRNGLCQNIDIAAYPTDAIGYFDAFLLCIAPVARTETIEPGTSVTIDVTARVNAVQRYRLPADEYLSPRRSGLSDLLLGPLGADAFVHTVHEDG